MLWAAAVGSSLQRPSYTVKFCTDKNFVKFCQSCLPSVLRTGHSPPHSPHPALRAGNNLLFRHIVAELSLVSFLKGSLRQLPGASTGRGSEWEWCGMVCGTAVRGVMINPVVFVSKFLPSSRLVCIVCFHTAV